MLDRNEMYIVQKGSEFLVGCPYDDSAYVRFSNSKYDGYQMKEFSIAIGVAKSIGGKVMVLNKLNGNLTGGWK